MKETKFLIHGLHRRDNGWVMYDCLSYMKQTAAEAVATCRQLNPQFEIQYVSLEN